VMLQVVAGMVRMESFKPPWNDRNA